jgi:hypothetical protein
MLPRKENDIRQVPLDIQAADGWKVTYAFAQAAAYPTAAVRFEKKGEQPVLAAIDLWKGEFTEPVPASPEKAPVVAGKVHQAIFGR